MSFKPRVVSLPLQADQSGPANSTSVLADRRITADPGRGSIGPHGPAANPRVEEGLASGAVLPQREGRIQPQPIPCGALPRLLGRHGAVGVHGLVQGEGGATLSVQKPEQMLRSHSNVLCARRSCRSV